jgi:HSP20 family protein
MRVYMNKMMEDAMKSPGMKLGEPYVYGFSLKVGPDGKPRIQEFGNTKPLATGPEDVGREPLTDVIEDEKTVSATFEIPGVEKDEIQLHVTEDKLTIRVNTPKRKYHKEADLPARVSPETTEATYNNGVLDVVIEKAAEKTPPGTRVKIK